MRWTPCVVAMAIGLCLPAEAGAAGVLDTYERLAERNLRPAPLVPTSAPPSLRPIDRSVDLGTTIGGRGYAIRLVVEPDAVVALSGGEFRRMKALLREYRRAGYTPRRTRVRGKRGFLLTRRLGRVDRSLAWTEGGVVYSLGSGTPRKVSLSQLRAMARGLDRLEREYVGGSDDPESGAGAVAVTTRRTVTIDVTFDATCAPPGSSATTIREGSASVTLLRRDGDRFSFDIAEHRSSADPWGGTVAGTISPAAITLDVRATGTIDGEACDSGPLRLTLDKRAL